MAKKKADRKLPPAPKKRRPKFVMSNQNSDIDEYGWDLRHVRLASPDDKSIAARPFCNVPVPKEKIKKYGADVTYIDPRYLQMLLDADVGVIAAVTKMAEDGYPKEQLSTLAAKIQEAFDKTVLLSIAQRFYEHLPLIAEFYAARAAYIQMHGSADDEDSKN